MEENERDMTSTSEWNSNMNESNDMNNMDAVDFSFFVKSFISQIKHSHVLTEADRRKGKGREWKMRSKQKNGLKDNTVQYLFKQ